MEESDGQYRRCLESIIRRMNYWKKRGSREYEAKDCLMLIEFDLKEVKLEVYKNEIRQFYDRQRGS